MLQDEEKRRFFSQLLAGHALGESLQLHVVEGFDLEPDGSYKSEFTRLQARFIAYLQS